MKLTYDSQADAMYIALYDTEICSTQLIAAEGNVGGIEIIGVQYCLNFIEREYGLDIPSQAAANTTVSNSMP